MTMHGGDPQRGESTGLVRLMDQHGVLILVVELAVLGVLTMGAILSDDFWTRRFEAVQNQSKPTDTTSRPN